MQEFIARQNVLHFEDLLRSVVTEEERDRIQGLLNDARAALELARRTEWYPAYPRP